jgi:hypothetical protein
VREIFAATDRASLVGRIAVKSCGAHQIWGSVANLVNTDSVGQNLAQQRPALQRVVN